METGSPADREPGKAEGRETHITCPHCGRSLPSDPRPLFCSLCGKPLAKPAGDSTLDPPTLPAEAPTLAAPIPVAGVVAGYPEAVGGYRLVRRLGGGGMGTVYEAEDPAGRRVALKLLAPGQELSADAVERFRREGRLASALAHPRCVFVYAADEDQGRPFIVMELMPGETLADVVRRRGPLPPEEAVAKILDVLDGLREAHRLGIVHRDVKPSNCFGEADGRVKVGDFGLSKSLAGDAHLTGTGSFLGTPLYSSPEQVRGEPLGPQSDVYSLAATLYCLLAGRAPFEGSDAAGTLARIVADPAPPLRAVRPGVPAGLERAVLRGLERDRQRRWLDLDAFREALLPFLPGGPAAAGRGERLAAFLVDAALLFVATPLVWLAANLADGRGFTARIDASRSWFLWQFGIGSAVWLVYFVVAERFWGCTPGKRVLRLRVCAPPGGDPPGWGRALLRFAVFFTLSFLTDAELFPGPDLTTTPSAEREAQQVRWWLVFNSLQVVGLGLLLSTMRRRNGWRLLHDFASGTRVVRLPEPAPGPGGGARAGGVPARPAGLPERVGPFAVRGAWRWDDAGRVLEAEDTALGRPVLLWLRPGGELPLSPARRAAARPTRLRWLAAGEQDGWRWDAFPAPAGRPLDELVSERGPRPWPEVRVLLEQLAAELDQSASDGSLPDSLTVGQVWVQPGGDALLLDVPLIAGDGEPAEGPGRRALTLLARVATLGLEGRARGDPGPVRVPVPGHAATLLERLTAPEKSYRDAAEFREALAATRDLPAGVTPDRRAVQVASLAALVFLGLWGMVGNSWVVGPGLEDMVNRTRVQGVRQRYLQQHEAGAVGDLVAGTLNPQPLARAPAVLRLRNELQLCGALRERLERDAPELRARVEAADWLTRWYYAGEAQSFYQQLDQAGPPESEPTTLAGAGTDPRGEAREPAPTQPEATLEKLKATFESGTRGRWALANLAFWPLLWSGWAFLTRGGLTYRMAGLRVVRGDGRRAGRLRCAWRTSLVWAPPALLLLAAMLLDQWHWVAPAGTRQAWVPWLVAALRWTSLGLLVAYPVLAFRYPRRGPDDLLAGTYVVPR